MVGKHGNFGGQTAWIYIPALSLTHQVILGSYLACLCLSIYLIR